MNSKIQLVAGVALIAICLPQIAVAQDASNLPIDEIIVTGTRAQQEQALSVKRDALGIMEVIAADEIGQLPDKNVAEAIERLPGVGVQYDQGEGRYVSVRGIPSDLNTTRLVVLRLAIQTVRAVACRWILFPGNCSTVSR